MTNTCFGHPPVQPSRREFVKLGLAGTASAFLAHPGKAGTGEVSGRVLVADGALGSTRARGLAGALVSNGCDVVRADADGYYRISRGEEGHVFVIKPAGFDVRLEAESMLPQHYVAVGAQGWQDFVLTRSANEHAFRAVLMADPQPENHRHIDFIRDGAVPLLAKTGASFGMTLGDLVGDDLSLLQRYNGVMGQAGLPIWNIGGNHDLDLAAPDHHAARAPFRAAYGPATYAFEKGLALFIVLDNVAFGGAREHGGDGRYRGRIGARQLMFVRNLLAFVPSDRLIVLCMHIPLKTEWDPASASENTQDADILLRLLVGRKAISFSGHMHTAEHLYLPHEGAAARDEHHHQILGALSGSWWSGPYDHRGRPVALGTDGAPAGFHVLNVDGTEHRTDFVALNQPQHRLRSILSRCAPCRTSGAYVIDGPATAQDLPCELVVNVFDGGPKTKVRCRLAGGEWQTMKRERRADPFVVDHFGNPNATRHDWVKPEPCEHLWSSPVIAPAGAFYRFEIEATDDFGRVLRDSVVLEMASSRVAAR
jgi:hypothetical protein